MWLRVLKPQISNQTLLVMKNLSNKETCLLIPFLLKDELTKNEMLFLKGGEGGGDDGGDHPDPPPPPWRP